MNKKVLQLILGGLFGIVVVLMVAYILQSKVLVKKDIPISGKKDQSYGQVVAKSDKLDYEGKYSENAVALESYIAYNPPVEDRNKASLKLAAAYFNAKEYDNAIIWYQKIGQESEDYKLAAYHGLAYTYRAKGDKQKAIEYLHSAIALMNDNKKYYNKLAISGDEQAIRILESQ